MKCTKIKMTRIRTYRHEFKNSVFICPKRVSNLHIFQHHLLFININCITFYIFFDNRTHTGKWILGIKQERVSSDQLWIKPFLFFVHYFCFTLIQKQLHLFPYPQTHNARCDVVLLKV